MTDYPENGFSFNDLSTITFWQIRAHIVRSCPTWEEAYGIVWTLVRLMPDERLESAIDLNTNRLEEMNELAIAIRALMRAEVRGRAIKKSRRAEAEREKMYIAPSNAVTRYVGPGVRAQIDQADSNAVYFFKKWYGNPEIQKLLRHAGHIN